MTEKEKIDKELESLSKPSHGSSFKIIIGDAGIPVYDKNWEPMNFVEVKEDEDEPN